MRNLAPPARSVVQLLAAAVVTLKWRGALLLQRLQLLALYGC